jgi:hypothetical protein
MNILTFFPKLKHEYAKFFSPKAIAGYLGGVWFPRAYFNLVISDI